MTITVERIEAEVVANPDRAIRDLRRFDRELDSVTSRTRTAKVDVDASGATRSAGQARDALGRFTRAAGEAGAAARGATGGVTALGNSLRGAGGGAGAGARGLGMFAARLPMMMVGLAAVASILPYVISAFNSLLGATIALGGQLTILAGGALAILPGLFIAAAGGIGALVLGLQGVGKAMKAYDAAAKEAANSTRSAANLARQRANAERNLERAVKAVALAQQDLARAEKEVAEARKAAARDLEDSRQRVTDAVLSEEEAIDAVSEAQERLRKAQQKTARSSMTLSKETDDFTGKVYEVARQSLDATDAQEDLADAERGVRKAVNDAAKATRERKRATEDLTEAERKGIEGSDRVVNANRRVEAAHRSVETAIEGVRDAQDALRRTTEQASQAQANLKAALAALTPAGREFVTFLRDEWTPAWKEVQQAAQEGLLPGVQDGLRNILGILPVVESAMHDFGHTVGDAFREWTEGITEDGGTRLENILKSSNRALGDLLTGFDHLGDAILTLTEAAGPALLEPFAIWFRDTMKEFSSDMDRWAKDGTLTTFFKDVKRVAGDVWAIIGNIASILGSLIVGSTPAGSSLLGSLRQWTEDMKIWMKDPQNRAKVIKWFNDAADGARVLMKMLGSVLKEILTIGGDGSPVMEDFDQVMKDIGESAAGAAEFLRDISTIVGPIATGVRAIAEAYDWLSDAIGGAQKAERTFNELLLGNLGKQKTEAQLTAEEHLKAAKKSREEWLKTGSSNVRQAERHEEAVRKAMEAVEKANKESGNDVYFNWTDVGRKIKTWGRDFHNWWAVDKNSAPQRLRKWMREEMFKPLGDGFSDMIGGIREAWRDLLDWFRNLDFPDIDWPSPPWGDGPGKGFGGSSGGGTWGNTAPFAAAGTGKGTAGSMAKSAVRHIGGRITSAYRTPAQNRAVGGSPTSYHIDRQNPAHDIAGSPGQMQAIFKWIASSYGSNVREMIYGNQMLKKGRVTRYAKNDHWDHVHVAHKGGEVTRDWPTMPGLRSDERPAILQVGERVVPAAVAQAGGGGGMDPAQFERILEKVLSRAKAPVTIDQTFNEKVDPMILSSELAWRLQ